MFKLKFGIIWTLFTGAIGAVFLVTINNSGGITINDRYVQNPTLSDLWPLYLFLGIFITIGIALIASGVKTVIANSKTNKYGIERYGYITDILPTGSYVNNRPELKAIVTVIDDDFGNTNTYEEIIGFDCNKYNVGDYIKVKHYENDINILHTLREDQVPYDKLDILSDKNIKENATYSNYGNPNQHKEIEEEVIIVNCKKYKRTN